MMAVTLASEFAFMFWLIVRGAAAESDESERPPA
jgi:hypothetical protein